MSDAIVNTTTTTAVAKKAIPAYTPPSRYIAPEKYDFPKNVLVKETKSKNVLRYKMKNQGRDLSFVTPNAFLPYGLDWIMKENDKTKWAGDFGGPIGWKTAQRDPEDPNKFINVPPHMMKFYEQMNILGNVSQKQLAVVEPDAIFCHPIRMTAKAYKKGSVSPKEELLRYVKAGKRWKDDKDPTEGHEVVPENVDEMFKLDMRARIDTSRPFNKDTNCRPITMAECRELSFGCTCILSYVATSIAVMTNGKVETGYVQFKLHGIYITNEGSRPSEDIMNQIEGMDEYGMEEFGTEEIKYQDIPADLLLTDIEPPAPSRPMPELEEPEPKRVREEPVPEEEPVPDEPEERQPVRSKKRITLSSASRKKLVKDESSPEDVD